MKTAALPANGCAVERVSAKALSIRANFAWSLVGNVGYAGCQWAMLVVIAKLGSVEMVGQFALAVALATPLMMFAQLQLRTLLATDARNEFRFVHYLAMRTLGAAAALLVVTAVVASAGYRPETGWVILGVAAFKAIELFCDVFYGRLQQQETMDRIGLSLIVRGLLSLVALAAVLSLGGGLALGTWAVAAAWLVVLVTWDSRSASPDADVPLFPLGVAAALWTDRRVLRRLLGLAWPLGCVSMLGALSSTLPRLLLERWHGERELGAFAAAASLMLAGHQVVAALAQSTSPQLAQLHAAGDSVGFRRLLARLLLLGLGIGAAGYAAAWCFGAELLAVCFRGEYAVYAGDLSWLMLAATMYYLCFFLNCAMSAARYLVVQLPLTLAVCTTAGLASWWWIPTHGVTGAAWSLVAAAGCQLVFSVAITGRLLRELPRGKPPVLADAAKLRSLGDNRIHGDAA